MAVGAIAEFGQQVIASFYFFGLVKNLKLSPVPNPLP
jgi:hypothetical protein